MSRDVQKEIKAIIDRDKVVLFMKGTASSPMCGLSATTVSILRKNDILNFKSIDVLQDFEIREGIKIFSDWPYIPLLYINGEFFAGSEEIQDLHEVGILKKKLNEI